MKKLTEHQKEVRRLARRVSELEQRLDLAERTDEQRTLWTWNDPPSWLGTAAGMAHTRGREIVLRAESGSSSPAKLAVLWVKRRPA
jgi:uncharacterized protein YlxW (UPF0749 family)